MTHVNGRNIYHAMHIQRLDNLDQHPDPGAVYRYRVDIVREDGTRPAEQANVIVEHRYRRRRVGADPQRTQRTTRGGQLMAVDRRCKHCGHPGRLKEIRTFLTNRHDGYVCASARGCIRRQEQAGQWIGALVLRRRPKVYASAARPADRLTSVELSPRRRHRLGKDHHPATNLLVEQPRG